MTDSLKIVAFEGREDEVGQAFPEINRFNQYRLHRLFTPSELCDIDWFNFREKILTANAVANILYENDAVSAICISGSLEWDSNHFGIPMAYLDCLLSEKAGADAAFDLVKGVLKEQQRAGFRHFSAHVDADNYPVFNVLSDQGFRLVDSKAVYIARSGINLSRAKKPVLAVRAFRPGDEAQVAALFSAANFKSRYSRDPFLSRMKSSELYVQWMERLCHIDPDLAVLFVVEREGAIVGCGGIEEIDFSVAGVAKKILGNGMFACNAIGTGSYYSVMYAGVLEGLRKYPLMEMKVSLSNHAARRVLEGLGCEMVGVQHALHLAC